MSLRDRSPPMLEQTDEPILSRSTALVLAAPAIGLNPLAAMALAAVAIGCRMGSKSNSSL